MCVSESKCHISCWPEQMLLLPDWVGSKFCMPIPASCMWELILNLTILDLTAFQAPPAVTKINPLPTLLPVQNSLGGRGCIFLVCIYLMWHRSQHGCNKSEVFVFPVKNNSLHYLFLIWVNSIFMRSDFWWCSSVAWSQKACHLHK